MVIFGLDIQEKLGKNLPSAISIMEQRLTSIECVEAMGGEG